MSNHATVEDDEEHPDADLFRTGHCHALAFVLNELSGAPIVALEAKMGRRWAIIHVMVEPSPGIYLDIDGERPIEDILFDADIDSDETATRIVEVDDRYMKAMARRGVLPVTPEIRAKATEAAEWVLEALTLTTRILPRP